MAVCPSDGFTYCGVDKLFDYIDRAEKILLGCPQAIPEGYEIPCLGIFDRDLWMTLMLFAREKEVNILTGECGECPDCKACGQSVQIFNQVYRTWTKPPSLKIKVAPDDGRSEARSPIERKGESKGWRDATREKIAMVFPEITSDETYLIPKTRQFLKQVWSARADLVLNIPAIVVKENCSNCADCVAVCPQGALTKMENAGRQSLIYEPLKCVRCKRCVTVCRASAIALEDKALSYRLFTGRVLVH